MTGRKGIHFGGGNIGRGLIGEKLHLSGFEVVFVDVMDKIISDLQQNKEYTVQEIGADGEKDFKITNYRAINSKTNEADVIEEIATADMVTCAVGPNILKFIAPVIAKGIEARKLDYPVAIIACENAIGATDTLAEFIKQKLSDETLENLPAKARFANSAVDRIVPNQDANAGLNVKIEKFYEWCVDQSPFEGYDFPKVKAIHYVNDLTPYIERKLFTVNTGHATAAYYGYQKGKKCIHDAMQDKEIHDIVRNVLSETAHLVCTKHDGITPEEQQEYVDMIINRISNPALEDVVTRVGRAPLRKLSRKERFIGPASQLAEMGEKVGGLLGSIEMALRFQNVEGDDESVELAKILKENDAKEATKKLTGLEDDHPLFDRVAQVVEKVQKDTK